MASHEVNKNSQDSTETPEKLRGEELLTHLLSISHQMAEMRSVAPLLSYVVDEVVALVGAERGYIVLLNNDGSLDFKARRRADGTDIQSDVDSISHTVLGEVVRTKESVVVRNALMDPQFGGAMSVMTMQLRSIMCSPLITRNRIIGAIYVENRSKSGRFSKEDVIPLEFFSNHAAVAIENAHLNENLETLVEERTSALAEAKDEAEAATRAKSTFLSTMTHELRTPMNGVLGMTSLLMDTPLNKEQKEIVDTIRASGDTLLTLINDILDFSKIEVQKVELEPVSFSLENCIEQAMDLVMPAAADKRLHLAYIIDEDVPLALVQDITRIRQILTNLLNNAVKFTEQGQVEVHVALSNPSNIVNPHVNYPNETERRFTEIKFTEIRFSVSDTGIGIPTDRISYLFQPFSQAERSTNRNYGGTGLGLVICKQLCELMGGTIEVESEFGVGSTFSFSITAQVDSALEDDQHTCDELLAGKRILLVTSSSLIERSVQQSIRNCQVSLVIRTMQPDSVQELDSINAVIIDATSVSFEWPSNLETIGINKPTILLTHWGDHVPAASSNYPLITIPVPIKNTQLRNELANITGSKIEAKSTKKNRSAFDVTMAVTYPLRILLAEDNIVNQKVALRMLERYGYQADLVENGLDAVDAFQKTVYDIVLMDIQMPMMDGVEATKRIRSEIPQDKQPYIVAMTASTMPEERERYLDAEMDEYISKPVSVDELQDALKIAALRQTHKID